MRKISPFQRRVLFYIEQAGGSYCPGDDIHPDSVSDLDYLVRCKRLTVEPTDAGPRYHLTAQGRADAS